MSATRGIASDLAEDERGFDTSIHPAQQRLSCEGCRKHKAKCRRINPDDPKCGRCLMHNIDCNTGKQRRIGRPRRRHAVVEATPTPQPRQQGAVDDTRHAAADAVAGAVAEEQQHVVTSRNLHLTSPSLHDNTPGSLHIGSLDDDFSSLTDGIELPESSGGSSMLIPSTPVQLHSSHTPLFRLGPRNEQHATSNSLHVSCAPTPILYPQPTMEVVSASMATLSLINIDLHNRMQVAKAHNHAMDLDLVIYRHGPLFINNLTLAEFTLKVSTEYLSILMNLHSAVSRRQSLPSAALYGSSTTSRALTEPLSVPMTLAMTSIFVQLLDLYELGLGCILARMERIKTRPGVAMSPPSILFPTYNAHPSVQGMLFVKAIHNLLQQVQMLLGISWSSEQGDGLLSSRQMHTLWNEMSDEFGSSVTRPDCIQSSLREAIGGFTVILARENLFGLEL